MKKFWRAFGVITIFVVTLPLQIILEIIGFALIVYCKIAFGESMVTYFKLGIAKTISDTKELIHWVKTGEWN